MRERVSKDGTRTYQVMFRDGNRQRSKTFATKAGAEKFADMIRLLGVKRALAELEPAIVGTTLDAVAALYWPWTASRHRSPRTVEDYKRDYVNWIKPAMGWRAAASIDENDVQAWVESMKGKLSAKSISDRHAILHGIFKWASAPRRGIVPAGHNPCIGTELPKKVKSQPRGMQPAEWQALIRALDQINPDAADLAEFLVASGWRWSEATALSTFEVEDYDDAMFVTVVQVARRQADGSTRIVTDAKSEAGKRRIRLDDDIAATVRRRVSATQPGSLVFTTTEGSMWNYSHFRSRFWIKALDVSNLQRRHTIHSLRHTAVGYLLLLGDAGLPEIQKRIGHESIQTTIGVYGSMAQDVNPAALDAVAALRGKRVRPGAIES